MVNRTLTVGRGNDALFVKDGVPIKFCFHRSVTQGRGQITRDVERHGGQVVQHERDANVLLVDEQEDITFLRRRYYSSTERYRLSLYLEPRGFVQSCIRKGDYHHLGPIKQGMPGVARRAARGPRVPFTEEDRDHLAYYLSTRCPTRDGRMGNSAYKDLERLGQTNDPLWAWARRHTFHSWREHYKNYSQLMDARIDYYLRRYKDVGHHFGHDLRRHNHQELRQEEEEEEEEEEEGDEEQQGVERQDRERREQVLPGAAAARRARDYPARHEQDLEAFDEEDGGDVEQEEAAIQEAQRVKRHGQYPRDVQQMQAKRARVSERSSNKRQVSGVEASRSKSRPERESSSETEESQEIEGSDLFGDREFDDSQDVDFPMPFSPRASPVPEYDGAPFSTQATLVASPLAAEKGPAAVPGTPMKVVEAQPYTVKPTVLPNSEQRVVVNRERVVVQRARVRGASAQPGPSVPREKRIRSDVKPRRNTRARSRLADLQPQPEPQVPRRENRGSKGKARAKEEALVLIEENMDVEEAPRETYAEEDVEPVVVTSGLSMRETFEDEMVVEGLLEASVGSGADEDEGSEDGEHDEDDDDEDEDDLPELPRFQVIEIESEPTDSDDAETHGSLVRGAVREGSAGGGDAAEGGEQDDQDDSSDDADADRIERMANVSLHAVPAPMPLQPRVTRARSKAATQTQMQAQTQVHSQTQRQTRAQTRLGNQAHTGAPSTTFPSPGTKARAVVDRFKEEEKRTPYAPPAGSRAARVVRKGGRR